MFKKKKSPTERHSLLVALSLPYTLDTEEMLMNLFEKDGTLTWLSMQINAASIQTGFDL